MLNGRFTPAVVGGQPGPLIQCIVDLPLTNNPGQSLSSGSNPNFPKGLSIFPSTPPTKGSAFISGFELQDQAEAIEKYGIAGRVWEAAYALISYIQSDSSWEFDPPFITPDQNAVTVVELGSGTGLVGVEVARRLSTTHPETTIIMTDLPEVCALLHQTVNAYQADLVNGLLVMPLQWGDLKHANQLLAKKEQSGSNSSITHIICSDLVYFPELLAPLLRSLLHLTQTCDPMLIISYKLRSLPKETPFWQAFGLWFEYHPVLVRRRPNSDPVETCDSEDVEWTRFGAAWDEPMFVFVGRRRPESRSWQTPDDDRDLLDGIGARGNRSRKGDDTFELLLLMTMQDG